MNHSIYNEKMEEISNLIKLFNQERKANKNTWLFFNYSIHGEDIAIKSFNTYIQVIKIGDRVKDSGPMDCKVKDMTQFLKDILHSTLLK